MNVLSVILNLDFSKERFDTYINLIFFFFFEIILYFSIIAGIVALLFVQIVLQEMSTSLTLAKLVLFEYVILVTQKLQKYSGKMMPMLLCVRYAKFLFHCLGENITAEIVEV